MTSATPLPLMCFKSRISGRNANVVLYPDRVEWSRKSSISWIIWACCTIGASLLFLRPQTDVEMIPTRAISKVSIDQGNIWSTVDVAAHSGQAIGFRTEHDTAREFAARLMEVSR